MLKIFLFSGLILILFFFHMYMPTDYDMGWHLRYGHDVLEDGKIWRTNDYSTEMARYKWVHTSWGLDILRFLLYDQFGIVGTSIAGALIATLTLLILAKAFNFNLWQSSLTLPLIALSMFHVTVQSLRGQEVSFLFTALLVWILRTYEKSLDQKSPTSNHQPVTNIHTPTTYNLQHITLWLTIPLFLIWTNLNGQFILGLGVFGVWIFIRILTSILKPSTSNHQLLTYNLQLITTFLFSCLVTLINPFGITMYKDILAHNQSTAVTVISEWVPVTAKSGITWYALITLCTALLGSIPIFLYKKRLTEYLPYLLVCLGLMGSAFFVGRYVWTGFLLMTAILGYLVNLIKPPNKIIMYTLLVFIFLIMGYVLVTKELPRRYLGEMSWFRYCRELGCSPNGAKFIETNFPGEKVWTDYNFGGWLIWNYPKVKPSIDGRMPLWIDPDTHYSPFLENYYPLETGRADPDESKYNIFFTKNARIVRDRLDQLVLAKKWAKVYQDSQASVYVRKSLLTQ